MMNADGMQNEPKAKPMGSKSCGIHNGTKNNR